MKKNQELFVLIHSLSTSEKRHFTLYCKAQGSSSSYLRLFQFISSQHEYDEAVLREYFEGEKFLAQLHVMKNYLRSMILRSLRNFHGATSKHAELKDCLRNVEILFFKELFTHARHELKRAEQIARKYEIHSGLYEVLDWKRRMAQHEAPMAFDTFTEILEDQHDTLNVMKNSTDYVHMIVDISQSILKEDNTPVRNEEWLCDVSNALSLEAMIMHYNANYFRDIGKEASGVREELFYELIETLESHPHRLKEDPGLYASSINNFIGYFAFQKRYKPALELINRAKVIYDRVQLKSEKKTLLKQILRTYSMELEIYRESDLVVSNQGFFEKVEGFVNENSRKMPKGYYASFCFQLGCIHFELENYKAALSWVNELLSSKEKDLRQDLIIHARLLNLMIHFELGNSFVLRYYVDSTRRYLKKRHLLGDFEMEMIRLFSRLGKVGEYEHKDLFSQQIAAVSGYQSAFSQRGTDLVDYIKWMKKHSKTKV